MKREDILDALEYLDEDLIQEADQTRNTEKDAGNTGKAGLRKRPLSYVVRWGTLAAGFTVLLVSFSILAGVRRTQNASPAPAQSIESTEAAASEGSRAELSAQEEMNPGEMDMAPMPIDAAKEAASAGYLSEENTAPANESVQIRITSDAGEVVFVLNDTPAAKSLAAQLPLHADTELYGSNEIVFHPEEPLDTADGLTGGGTAGYLAYFAPWDNVVMYYGDFDEYPGLYILGEAVSGAEIIKYIRGGIIVEGVKGVKRDGSP